MLNLLADLLTGRLKAQARQRAIVLTLAGLAGLMLVVALAHALSALRIWLAARYDPIAADLIVGGGFLVMAAVLAIAAKIVATRKPPVDASAALAPMALAMVAELLKPRGEQPAPPPQAAPRAADAPAPDAPDAPAAPRGGSALLVLLPLLAAGLLLGRKPRD